MGREQKIAIEIAVEEFNSLSCFNSKLILNFKNSRGNSAQTVAAAMDLAHSKRVQAIIGTITQNEATLATEINNTRNNIPIISLSSPTSTDSLSTPLPYFIQLGDDITLHMQCIAAIVGSYKWRKVTTIYEYSNGFSSNPGVLTLLSYSLRLIGSEIDHHLALPSLSSLLNPSATIQQELNRLKSKSNRIFLIVQSSLELATLLFEKAKEMGMMENGYVWIIPDGVAGFLDSADSSVISNMQGVLGFKSNYIETSEDS
ncbi:hypothetical protein L6164_009018 [Bauhinia variegata]|uniref:Uncharacterized protein n=1 Tax=Bauhinia variegata TaxID=167791 RepID=A0ACB9PII3_BAUVA|nr:hypothetical protein L6164_009018 [Bauhinia variegata]